MIKIDENFYIDADDNCYTLKEKTKVEDKKKQKLRRRNMESLWILC